MKIFINEVERNVTVSSVATLLDIVSQIEPTLPQGHLITEVVLNNNVLENNWFQNAGKIYVLDDDILKFRIDESSELAQEALANSKQQFQILLDDFEKIADAFRMQDEVEANTIFIKGIENLQWYLKLIEDATFLLGRPFDKIKVDDVPFTHFTDELGVKLDKIIQTQSHKDWILLADMIEYEMLPSLTKIGEIYRVLGV